MSLRVGHSGGAIVVLFEGDESGREMRKFVGELTQIVGRGRREFMLGDQRVIVVVSNDGAPAGEHHVEVP